jgi:hypothetical protein
MSGLGRGSCGEFVVAALVLGVVWGHFIELRSDLAECSSSGVGYRSSIEGGGANGASRLSDDVGAEHDCVYSEKTLWLARSRECV